MTRDGAMLAVGGILAVVVTVVTGSPIAAIAAAIAGGLLVSAGRERA